MKSTLVYVMRLLVPDIERGVCEYQIREGLGDFAQGLDTVAGDYLI